MPTATIEVQYVNGPKPGKKQGSVKAVSGEYYGVDPSQLGLFQPGKTYTIEYETRVYNEKEYRNFRRMDGALPLPAPTGKPSHTQAVEMACMGIVGRAVQGAGTVPDEETLTTWFKAIRFAWIEAFASINEPGEREF